MPRKTAECRCRRLRRSGERLLFAAALAILGAWSAMSGADTLSVDY